MVPPPSHRGSLPLHQPRTPHRCHICPARGARSWREQRCRGWSYASGGPEPHPALCRGSLGCCGVQGSLRGTARTPSAGRTRLSGGVWAAVPRAPGQRCRGWPAAEPRVVWGSPKHFGCVFGPFQALGDGAVVAFCWGDAQGRCQPHVWVISSPTSPSTAQPCRTLWASVTRGCRGCCPDPWAAVEPRMWDCPGPGRSQREPGRQSAQTPRLSRRARHRAGARLGSFRPRRNREK